MSVKYFLLLPLSLSLCLPLPFSQRRRGRQLPTALAMMFLSALSFNHSADASPPSTRALPLFLLLGGLVFILLGAHLSK